VAFVVIASTGGSVLGGLLRIPYFRERIHSVVSDRECGAIKISRDAGVPSIVHATRDALQFSDYLLESLLADPQDLYVSFYTKLFRGRFPAAARGRLVNCHPSILPAFPGLDGYGDAVRAGARFIGATIHYVDEGIDTGAPIIQSCIPFDPALGSVGNRHAIFIQQQKMLLQVVKYIDEKRLTIGSDDKPQITNVRYNAGEYAPNLDHDLADLSPGSGSATPTVAANA
jgi:phosphoribosylglycinamide formyltransferase-1